MFWLVAGGVVALCVVVFLWFWWTGPRNLVPIHSTEDELRRLEVQDRLRQTNYQILTAVGLGATFVITMAQFIDSRNHWDADFKTKAEQDRLATFMNAVKLIKDGSDTESAGTNAGVGTLGSLAVPDDTFRVVQATQILSGFVTSQTSSAKGKLLGLSEECKDHDWAGNSNDLPAPVDVRPEAKSAVQTAMRALGDGRMAAYRQRREGNRCVSHAPQLRIEHAGLDGLDLSGLDLSCSMLSQTRFRRTSLKGAKLAFSDLRGTRFADYDIPDSPSNRTDKRESINGDALYRVAGKPGPEEWKVYRCWISDLRYADLSYTQLDGAVLTGADLREADFTGARFSDTDLSRANLTGAYGLTREMLKHACAGIAPPNYVDKNAQPVGLPAWIGDARLRPCLVDEEKASKTAIDPIKEGVDLPKKEDVIAAADELAKKLAQRSWWRRLLGEYRSPLVAPVLAVLSAILLFELVGKFAHSKLTITGGLLEALPVRFPEKSLTYSAKELKLFKDQYPGLARQYRFPILVPLDLIVMGSIAAAAIYSSWTWFCLAQSNLSAHFILTVCSIFPLLYLLTDFAEDMVLCRYLGNRHFDEMSVSHLKRLTFAKMITFGLSGVQVAASALLALLTAALPWAVAWAESLGWL